MAIFKGVCKKQVSLPLVKDEDDAWYCQRLINEALIAMTQNENGPVQINVPLVGGQNELVDASIKYANRDKINKIQYIANNDEKTWGIMAKKLITSSKILVVMGQTSNIDFVTKKAMDKFFEIYKCPLLTDNLCNYRCPQIIFAENTIKALNGKTVRNYLPDIVITLGCNFQERIKDVFKVNRTAFEHWSIEPHGVVKDVFKSQTALFDCKPSVFFSKMCDDKFIDRIEADGSYLTKWKILEEKAKLPDMPFCNFYAVGEFAKLIPNNSILHLSILNNTRLMQFFKLDESIKVYSNVNAFGIDGCLPTFMGQAYATNELAFILIGDLSFFYGMNAIAIKHRKNNIRIMVINNGGGAEFHIMPDSNAIPTIDLHIGAAHNRQVKGWAESMGYEYLKADSKESLGIALKSFISTEHDNPVLLEVFTNMKHDGEHLLSVYRYLENEVKELL